MGPAAALLVGSCGHWFRSPHSASWQNTSLHEGGSCGPGTTPRDHAKHTAATFACSRSARASAGSAPGGDMRSTVSGPFLHLAVGQTPTRDDLDFGVRPKGRSLLCHLLARWPCQVTSTLRASVFSSAKWSKITSNDGVLLA